VLVVFERDRKGKRKRDNIYSSKFKLIYIQYMYIYYTLVRIFSKFNDGFFFSFGVGVIIVTDLISA